jgi:hypothetical protein
MAPVTETAVPFVEWDHGQAYFTSADGREWHVYDTVVHDRKHRPLKYGSTAARYRVFVAPDRARMVYQFGDGELRDLEPAHLERQLKQAITRDAWSKTFRPLRRSSRS